MKLKPLLASSLVIYLPVFACPPAEAETTGLLSDDSRPDTAGWPP